MKYTRGDVVLVLFPFREQPQAKLRPAVVLQPGHLHSVLLCKITSQVPTRGEFHRAVRVGTSEYSMMGLAKDSYVLFDEIREIPESLIYRKIGQCPFVDDIDRRRNFHE